MAAAAGETAAEGIETGLPLPTHVDSVVETRRLQHEAAAKVVRSKEEDTEDVEPPSEEQHQRVERDTPTAGDATAAIVGDQVGVREEVSAGTCETGYRSILRTEGKEQVRTYDLGGVGI